MLEWLSSFVISVLSKIFADTITPFLKKIAKSAMNFIRANPVLTLSVLITLCISFSVAIYNIWLLRPVSETFEGRTYAVYNEGRNWFDAKKRCEELGGHLVVISSEAEQRFIERLLYDCQKPIYWIGLSYEEGSQSWQWVANESASYTYWEEYQPNQNRDFEENYVGLVAKQITWGNVTGFPYKWHDFELVGSEINPLSNFGFICEWD